MGTKGREIVGRHAERVIEPLNKAFAVEDEVEHEEDLQALQEDLAAVLRERA